MGRKCREGGAPGRGTSPDVLAVSRCTTPTCSSCQKLIGCRMSRTAWKWARLAGGAAILAVLVWRLGPGRSSTASARSTAGRWRRRPASRVLTTVCCAWRWSLVARGLGVDLPLAAAVAAYYRSQFLNTTLPGGVLGDVHRGVRHGRDAGDIGRGLRAVAWERFAGQVVQVAITVVALLVLPSPVHSRCRGRASRPSSRRRLLVVRFRGRRRWAPWARTGAATCATAARAAGVAGHRAGVRAWSSPATSRRSWSPRRPPGRPRRLRLLPLALLVLLAMALRTSAAGGPRGRGGLGVRRGRAGRGQGVATAVVYGVMVLVASLPGAVVLVVGWLRRRRPGAPEPALAGASGSGAGRSAAWLSVPTRC